MTYWDFALANKHTIMYKIKFQMMQAVLDSVTKIGSSHFFYYFQSDASTVNEVGVYYYTTNSSDKTYLPISNCTFDTYNGTRRMYLPLAVNETTEIASKPRQNSTAPIFVLIKGLQANTAYHVGGYMKLGSTYREFMEVNISTKPETSNTFIFDDVIINNLVPENFMEAARSCKESLETDLPIVSAIFEDATNITAHYAPEIVYDENHWAANSAMKFNCYSGTVSGESQIIHELEHNLFVPYMEGSTELFSINENVLRFMEFATDCEGASWGQISDHYYPNISSQSYDYIDDYLVVMATDVDYLFNVNS